MKGMPYFFNLYNVALPEIFLVYCVFYTQSPSLQSNIFVNFRELCNTLPHFLPNREIIAKIYAKKDALILSSCLKARLL